MLQTILSEVSLELSSSVTINWKYPVQLELPESDIKSEVRYESYK